MFRITRLHHSSLLVSDLPTSRKFYEDILGLRPSPSRPQMAYDGVWYDIGPQQIHLIALPNPDAGLLRPEHGGRDRHVALLVEDLQDLKRILENAGIAYTDSRSGRPALFCRDPEGNAVEFIEWAP